MYVQFSIIICIKQGSAVTRVRWGGNVYIA